MEKIGMKDLSIGDEFLGFCIIRKKEMRHKHTGEAYLSLELGDFSGRLPAKIWREVDQHYNTFFVGQVVKIKGKIQSYRNSRELFIEKIRLAKGDEVKLKQLLPCCQKDVNQLKRRFLSHYSAIKSNPLRELLDIIFPDDITLDNYLELPSGKLWHHNYLFGILEHLTCQLDLAETISINYPLLDINLLKCGIILRQLGKAKALNRNGFIDYSTEGRLIGERMLSGQLVLKAIQQLEEFPEGLMNQLMHLLIFVDDSNGKSSVQPMTFEALVLNEIERSDIQINASERIILNDGIPGSEWTKFNNLLNRFIYVGDKTENNKNGKEND